MFAFCFATSMFGLVLFPSLENFMYRIAYKIMYRFQPFYFLVITFCLLLCMGYVSWLLN